MKKMIFTLTMVLLSLAAMAQNEPGSFSFIPRVGLVLTGATASDHYYLYDGIGDKELKPTMRIGVTAGIDAEYQMSALLSLSAGLMYAMQGHGYDDIESQKDYSATLHCVNVPVMLNCYVVKGLAVKVGIQPGYAFYKKSSYSQKIGNAWGNYSTSGTGYANFDFCIPVGLSYDFDRFRVDLRYHLGLVNINKLDNGKLSSRTIQATVGYRL